MGLIVVVVVVVIVAVVVVLVTVLINGYEPNENETLVTPISQAKV